MFLYIVYILYYIYIVSSNFVTTIKQRIYLNIHTLISFVCQILTIVNIVTVLVNTFCHILCFYYRTTLHRRATIASK